MAYSTLRDNFWHLDEWDFPEIQSQLEALTTEDTGYLKKHASLIRGLSKCWETFKAVNLLLKLQEQTFPAENKNIQRFIFESLVLLPTPNATPRELIDDYVSKNQVSKWYERFCRHAFVKKDENFITDLREALFNQQLSWKEDIRELFLFAEWSIAQWPNGRSSSVRDTSAPKETWACLSVFINRGLLPEMSIGASVTFTRRTVKKFEASNNSLGLELLGAYFSEIRQGHDVDFIDYFLNKTLTNYQQPFSGQRALYNDRSFNLDYASLWSDFDKQALHYCRDWLGQDDLISHLALRLLYREAYNDRQQFHQVYDLFREKPSWGSFQYLLFKASHKSLSYNNQIENTLKILTFGKFSMENNPRKDEILHNIYENYFENLIFHPQITGVQIALTFWGVRDYQYFHRIQADKWSLSKTSLSTTEIVNWLLETPSYVLEKLEYQLYLPYLANQVANSFLGIELIQSIKKNRNNQNWFGAFRQPHTYLQRFLDTLTTNLPLFILQCVQEQFALEGLTSHSKHQIKSALLSVAGGLSRTDVLFLRRSAWGEFLFPDLNNSISPRIFSVPELLELGMVEHVQLTARVLPTLYRLLRKDTSSTKILLSAFSNQLTTEQREQFARWTISTVQLTKIHFEEEKAESDALLLEHFADEILAFKSKDELFSLFNQVSVYPTLAKGFQSFFSPEDLFQDDGINYNLLSAFPAFGSALTSMRLNDLEIPVLKNAWKGLFEYELHRKQENASYIRSLADILAIKAPYFLIQKASKILLSKTWSFDKQILKALGQLVIQMEKERDVPFTQTFLKKILVQEKRASFIDSHQISTEPYVSKIVESLLSSNDLWKDNILEKLALADGKHYSQRRFEGDLLAEILPQLQTELNNEFPEIFKDTLEKQEQFVYALSRSSSFSPADCNNYLSFLIYSLTKHDPTLALEWIQEMDKNWRYKPDQLLQQAFDQAISGSSKTDPIAAIKILTNLLTHYNEHRKPSLSPSGKWKEPFETLFAQDPWRASLLLKTPFKRYLSNLGSDRHRLLIDNLRELLSIGFTQETKEGFPLYNGGQDSFILYMLTNDDFLRHSGFVGLMRTMSHHTQKFLLHFWENDPNPFIGMVFSTILPKKHGGLNEVFLPILEHIAKNTPLKRQYFWVRFAPHAFQSKSLFGVLEKYIRSINTQDHQVYFLEDSLMELHLQPLNTGSQEFQRHHDRFLRIVRNWFSLWVQRGEESALNFCKILVGNLKHQNKKSRECTNSLLKAIINALPQERSLAQVEFALHVHWCHHNVNLLRFNERYLYSSDTNKDEYSLFLRQIFLPNKYGKLGTQYQRARRKYPRDVYSSDLNLEQQRRVTQGLSVFLENHRLDEKRRMILNELKLSISAFPLELIPTVIQQSEYYRFAFIQKEFSLEDKLTLLPDLMKVSKNSGAISDYTRNIIENISASHLLKALQGYQNKYGALANMFSLQDRILNIVEKSDNPYVLRRAISILNKEYESQRVYWVQDAAEIILKKDSLLAFEFSPTIRQRCHKLIRNQLNQPTKSQLDKRVNDWFPLCIGSADGYEQLHRWLNNLKDREQLIYQITSQWLDSDSESSPYLVQSFQKIFNNIALHKAPSFVLMRSFAKLCYAEDSVLRSIGLNKIRETDEKYPKLHTKLANILLQQLAKVPPYQDLDKPLINLTRQLVLDRDRSVIHNSTIWKILEAEDAPYPRDEKKTHLFYEIRMIARDLLLERESADFIEPKNLASLAHHSFAEFRALAYDWYQDSDVIWKLKYNPDEFFLLLQGKEEEAFEFAVSYLPRILSGLKDAHILALCDHNNKTIQAFGLEQIQEKLDYDPKLLKKLSEHPANQVEIAVVEFLETKYSSPSASDFAEILPFFRRVLSKVNRQRSLKNRLWTLLEQYAEQSEELAKEVVSLVSWISAGDIIQDRERAILFLEKTRQSHSDIDLPYTIELPPIRNK